MDNEVEQHKAAFTDKELKRISEAIETIDSAIIEAIGDIDKDEYPDSGLWNFVIGFYIQSKTHQVGAPFEATMKGIYAQANDLNKRLDL